MIQLHTKVRCKANGLVYQAKEHHKVSKHLFRLKLAHMYVPIRLNALFISKEDGWEYSDQTEEHYILNKECCEAAMQSFAEFPIRVTPFTAKKTEHGLYAPSVPHMPD